MYYGIGEHYTYELASKGENVGVLQWDLSLLELSFSICWHANYQMEEKNRAHTRHADVLSKVKCYSRKMEEKKRWYHYENVNSNKRRFLQKKSSIICRLQYRQCRSIEFLYTKAM